MSVPSYVQEGIERYRSRKAIEEMEALQEATVQKYLQEQPPQEIREWVSELYKEYPAREYKITPQQTPEGWEAQIYKRQLPPTGTTPFKVITGYGPKGPKFGFTAYPLISRYGPRGPEYVWYKTPKPKEALTEYFKKTYEAEKARIEQEKFLEAHVPQLSYYGAKGPEYVWYKKQPLMDIQKRIYQTQLDVYSLQLKQVKRFEKLAEHGIVAGPWVIWAEELEKKTPALGPFEWTKQAFYAPAGFAKTFDFTATSLSGSLMTTAISPLPVTTLGPFTFGAGGFTTAPLSEYWKTTAEHPGLIAGEIFGEYFLAKYIWGPALEKVYAKAKGPATRFYRYMQKHQVPSWQMGEAWKYSHPHYVLDTQLNRMLNRLTIPVHRKVVWPVKYEVGHLWRGSSLQKILRSVAYKKWAIEQTFPWSPEAPKWFIGLSGVPKKLIPHLAFEYALEAHQSLYYPVVLKALGREQYILALMKQPSASWRHFIRTTNIQTLGKSWILRGRVSKKFEARVETFITKTERGKGRTATSFASTLEKTLGKKGGIAPTQVPVLTTQGRTISQIAQQTSQELTTLTVQKQLTVRTITKHLQPKSIAHSLAKAKAPTATTLHKWLGKPYPFISGVKGGWAKLGFKMGAYPLTKIAYKAYPKPRKKKEELPITFPSIKVTPMLPTERKKKVEPFKGIRYSVKPFVSVTVASKIASALKSDLKIEQAQTQIQQTRQELQRIQLSISKPIRPIKGQEKLTPISPPLPHVTLPRLKRKKDKFVLFGAKWFLKTHPIPTASEFAKRLGAPLRVKKRRRRRR